MSSMRSQVMYDEFFALCKIAESFDIATHSRTQAPDSTTWDSFAWPGWSSQEYALEYFTASFELAIDSSLRCHFKTSQPRSGWKSTGASCAQTLLMLTEMVKSITSYWT